MYGNVNLDESLTINEGETPTIPDGSSLNGDGKLTNNGTIIVENGGTLTGNEGGTVVYAPTITTTTLPNGTVGEYYTATLQATGNNITWSASGLPAGLTLDANTGAITGTPSAEGSSIFTVKAENSAGSVSKELSLTVSEPAPITYTIAADVTPSEADTATADKATEAAGDTVKLTATANSGYRFTGWTFSDNIIGADSSSANTTFTMPAGRVEIEVSFREIAVELPFTDVPEDAWYADAAAYVYEHGLMAGTSATAFSPDATTSRSMIATILWRMAGSPVVNFGLDYTDVVQGQWYSKAIRWVASEGIVGGYGNGLFGTNDPIAREQFDAMLYRFAQEQSYDVSLGAEGGAVAGAVDDSSAHGPLHSGDGTLTEIRHIRIGQDIGVLTDGQATRAQAAVMLMRFCELDK